MAEPNGATPRNAVPGIPWADDALAGLGPLPRRFGPYELLEKLGQGGMAIVFKARQLRPQRLVALKIPLYAPLNGIQAFRRFQIETQAVARLEHEHIVRIYECGELEGVPYFSMEYMDGGSLATTLSGEPRPARDAAQLVLTLAHAVHFAHQHGVVHRDIKPANVLLGSNGALKLTDFGLAKLLDTEERPTRSEAILGTAKYMAPEQAEGRLRDIGPRTDVYALGVLLYELLTGRPPFRGDTDLSIRAQIVAAEPVPPRRLRSQLPRDLETVCLKCLQNDPGKRYVSAEALADDLRSFLCGEAVLARPIGQAERLWRWCRRNPVVASLTTAVAILLIAGTAISVYFAVQSVQRADDLRKQLYISNVNRALGEWQNNNVSVAERLLNDCPEDLRGWEWHYARRLFYKERVSIHAYFAPGASWYGNVAHHTVAFSPDSQWVAAMDWDHTLKLWDVATGTKRRTMQGDTGVVFSIAFSRDGKWVASGNSDHTVRIWNTETGKLVRILRGHKSLVYHVQFSPDGRNLISAGAILVDHKEWLSQMEIIVWQADTGQLLSRRIAADANPEWGGVAFSPNGQHFAAEGEKTFPGSGPSSMGLIGSLLGQGPFMAAAILVRQAGGENVTLKLGDTATGQGFHTKAMHYGPISDSRVWPGWQSSGYSGPRRSNDPVVGQGNGEGNSDVAWSHRICPECGVQSGWDPACFW